MFDYRTLLEGVIFVLLNAYVCVQTCMCLCMQEVGSLIRDSVEQKVKQFQEARHQKIQPKPKKDVNLNTPLCLEGIARMCFVPQPNCVHE